MIMLNEIKCCKCKVQLGIYLHANNLDLPPMYCNKCLHEDKNIIEHMKHFYINNYLSPNSLKLCCLCNENKFTSENAYKLYGLEVCYSCECRGLKAKKDYQLDSLSFCYRCGVLINYGNNIYLTKDRYQTHCDKCVKIVEKEPIF
jgi:hypothetical protein